MFDIGFWELSVIGVVGLIVIGPERLPGVARTAGFWFGKMSRFVSNVKADIDRELKADELQRTLKQQADSAGIHEIIEETREAVEGLEKETRAAADAAADAFDEVPQDYLVKSEDNRYVEVDDEDYFDDDEDVGDQPEPQGESMAENEEPQLTAAAEQADESETKSQQDDNKA